MRPRLIITIIFFLFTSSTVKSQKFKLQDPKHNWQTIDSLMELGLIKSAEPLILEIYTRAKTENNIADYIKSVIYKIRISKIDDDFNINTLIAQLENEITGTSSPQKEILHSILAELYANFYQQNKWTIDKRTQLSGKLSDDINQWTKNNFQLVIKKHFERSLSNTDLLFSTKAQSLKAILYGDEEAIQFQPTLLDLLAGRLINYFFQADLMGNAYKSNENLDYFLPSEKFITLEIDSSKTIQTNYFILNLYQKLLSYHQLSILKDAFIHTDLERLKFVKSHFLSAEKYESNYLNALNNIITAFPKHYKIAEVEYEKARVYAERGRRYDPFTAEEYQWEFTKAKEVCKTAIRKFPESLGAKYCKEMQKRLIEKSARISLQKIQLPQKPILASVEYKNCKKLYFRIIKLPYEKELSLTKYDRLDQRLDFYLDQQPTEEWFLDMPDVGDMQTHNLQIRLPQLSYGYYVLLVSSTDKFDKQSLLSSNDVLVSGLSFIHRDDAQSGADIFVLDRLNGLPLKNVRLDVYNMTYDYDKRRNEYKKENTYYSDQKGYIRIHSDKKPNERKFVFSFKNDTLIDYIYPFRYRRTENKKIQTHFFSDRKIYRPGQIVYFKGIVVESEGKKFKTLPDQKTSVDFYDVNRQKISTQTFTSNAFGSFHGSFVIPQKVLNGNMRIQNETGSHYFSVEEYKRPTFEVLFDDIQSQYRIKDIIELTGVAKSFSGSTLNNVDVKYSVSRSAHWFLGYKGYWPGRQSRQIESMEIKTDNEGRFKIRFTASPDESGEDHVKSIYNFHVAVEITDVNGETQSAEKNIPVSYTNLILSSTIPKIIEKNSFDSIPVSVENFYGQKQSVNVSASIFKISHPDKAFTKRIWKRPDQFVMDKETFYSYFPNNQYDDEKNQEKWAIENQVFQAEINTAETNKIDIFDLSDWENAIYKLVLKTKDHYDEEIESTYYFTLYSLAGSTLPIPEFNWFDLSSEKAIPGDTISFVLGSSAKNVSVLYELHHENTVLKSQRFRLSNEQKQFEIPITRKHIGNLELNLLFVIDNQIYKHWKKINVKDPKRVLNIGLETFRSVLHPGSSEEWSIKIGNYKNQKASAELMCALTDISVDAILPNQWHLKPDYFIHNFIRWNESDNFVSYTGRSLNRNYYGYYFNDIAYKRIGFDFNIYGLTDNNYYHPYKRKRMPAGPITIRGKTNSPDKEMALSMTMTDEEVYEEDAIAFLKIESSEAVNPLSDVSLRKNFNETAFFYPDLKTDDKGNILIKFTGPEALSRWKFMALTHTKDLRTALLEKEIITQKDLMLNPNVPRFFRQGDTMYFNTKISNLSDKEISGQTKLQFFNAENMQEIKSVILEDDIQDFTIDAKSNINKDWKITIPEGVNALLYRLTAAGESHTDGEERTIPVLSNRILVTESLPIHLNPQESKILEFEPLLKSDSSQSIRHHRLKLEMCSNPNWYAIQALPHIAASKIENSIALFNRFYANSMANFIMNANPRIKQIFEQWKSLSPDAFFSKLEKNQELKSVLLAETPWIMEAKNERERKRRLALFFDLNTMNQELETSFDKLVEMQRYDGSWSWYEGGQPSRYITQHILTGMLRLKHRGVLNEEKWQSIKPSIDQAIKFLNNALIEDFENLKKREKVILDDDHLRNTHIQYLFALSYGDRLSKVDESLEKVIAYYLDQEQKYWMKRNNYLQAMIALTLHRKGDVKTSNLIVRSLKERASLNDEMGMYWKQNRGYYWYQAPIETQALLIEAFLEIADDKSSVIEMKKWLLKQKQTQMWSTAKSSVEAVNALLLENTNVLGNTALIEVKLGGKAINIEQAEAGTGFYEKTWNGGEIKSRMGTVQVKNPNKNIGWGALHWQYFEDLDKIKAYETPLSIEKQLFIKESENNKIVLIPVSPEKPIKVGDKVVSRMIVRVDRDMEFIHLKDMRAAAFEPRTIFSRYRYQNRLGYYESTKDAASHFYFDRLQKGTYVFEYEMFATQQGHFSNGISSIQCLYAPEFVSHSEGIKITVAD